ncbi:MAG: YebC/PmpR family DNA-binding transcriptional regulator [Panacagrimonas sp.]
MGRGPSIAGRKNAADAQRAKLFTKLIREITVAARSGGADPAANARLRLAMDRALSSNMPKDTLERAIKRGSGGLDGAQMQEVRYEGYGPGGIAVIVDCMTDNPTRTVADVRHAFSKGGGNLGTSGSVAFQFQQVGQLWFDVSADPDAEERLLEAALEAGADDVQSEGAWCEVLSNPDQFETLKGTLADAGFQAEEARVTMRPDNRTALDAAAAEAFEKLLHRLEDLDDAQDVFHNAELPDEYA